MELILWFAIVAVYHAIKIKKLARIAKNAVRLLGDLYAKLERASKVVVTYMLKPPKTFYSLHSVARIMGIPKSTIDEAFKDGIDTIGAIKPIVHLFHKFEEGDEFSYAILKKHFDRWQKTGKVPKVSSGRPPKWKTDSTYTNLNIPIKKDLYDRFKHMVDKANAVSSVKISYRDMIYIAMQEAIDRRPSLK